MSDETRSDRERAAPAAGVADLANLVDGNSGFAFDLFRALKARDGNLFYSPHSISVALAMTYAGAGGETASQMAETLHFLLPGDRLHPAFNALDHELASRGAGARGGERFRLNIVNAVWGQQGHEFREAFLLRAGNGPKSVARGLCGWYGPRPAERTFFKRAYTTGVPNDYSPCGDAPHSREGRA